MVITHHADIFDRHLISPVRENAQLGLPPAKLINGVTLYVGGWS